MGYRLGLHHPVAYCGNGCSHGNNPELGPSLSKTTFSSTNISLASTVCLALEAQRRMRQRSLPSGSLHLTRPMF